jgi:O-antigen/teichoic acid export membrane protein
VRLIHYLIQFQSKLMKINHIQRQSLISFISLILITLIGYLSTIYFAHMLGPTILGVFFLFLAFYNIFDLLGDGGFGGAAVKRISEGRDQNSYFSAFIALRLLLLCVTIIALIIFTRYFTIFPTPEVTSWFILALIVGTILSVFYTGNYGRGQIGIIQVSNLLNTITKILVQVGAVFLGFGLGGLIGGFIVGMVGACLINFRYIQLGFTDFNMNHIKNLFSFSLWGFIASGGALIYTNTDTILIGYFMSAADVGIYRVAFQLAGAAAFILGSFSTVLYPKISEWHTKGNLQMIEKTVSRAIMYSLVLAIPVTAGALFFSDKLMYFCYGESFESGSVTLIVLCLVQIATIFMTLETMCLSAMDMPHLSFRVTGISAILNIVLNIVLIPRYGIVGAAVATLFTLTVNALYANALLRSFIRISLEKKLLYNIFFASFLMSGFLLVYVLVIPVSTLFRLLLGIMLGGTLYSIILVSIDHGIRTEIKTILKDIGLES